MSGCDSCSRNPNPYGDSPQLRSEPQPMATAAFEALVALTGYQIKVADRFGIEHTGTLVQVNTEETNKIGEWVEDGDLVLHLPNGDVIALSLSIVESFDAVNTPAAP